MDVLIRAGANVNKQESLFGLTPLFFAIRGSKLSLITETLLIYGGHPNVIADNNTTLDVANNMKEKSISKLLINYGGQTISQLEKEEYKFSKLQSLLPTLDEEATAKSILTKNDITMFFLRVKIYSQEEEGQGKSLEIQSFTSLMSSFT